MDNMFWLGGRLYRVDYSGSAPPWPMLVWDQPTLSWQAIGQVDNDAPTTTTTGGTPGRIWAPLAAGERPGPELVSDGLGQCIMVPIS